MEKKQSIQEEEELNCQTCVHGGSFFCYPIRIINGKVECKNGKYRKGKRQRDVQDYTGFFKTKNKIHDTVSSEKKRKPSKEDVAEYM